MPQDTAPPALGSRALTSAHRDRPQPWRELQGSADGAASERHSERTHEGDGARYVVRAYPGASRVEFVGPPASRRCSISARGVAPDRNGSVIVGYSEGSRRGLHRHLTTHRRDAVPAFGTFSTPDRLGDPPGPAEVETMRRGLFDAIRRRPEFAGVGAVWLRQWECRQQGVCAGLYAAHLHLLAYDAGGWTADRLAAFSGFMRDVWADLGGGGVDIGPAGNAEAVRNYLVSAEKITTDEDKAGLIAAFPGGTGRAWGTFRKQNLPTVEGVERTVTATEFDALRAEAVAEADATYRALGSSRRYRDLPQNGRAAVSVGQPERFLCADAGARPRRRSARDRQALRQTTPDRPVRPRYVLAGSGFARRTNDKRPRICVSASSEPLSGCGAKEIRTPDLCSAIAALYQLSYSPEAPARRSPARP